MNQELADKIAGFVWDELLGLDPEETAGSDHLDKDEFTNWLMEQG